MSRINFTALVALAVTLPACTADEATAPELAEEPDALYEVLEEAIQDEYRAETIYLGVMDDFGTVRPFSNIVGAEVKHSQAIARLFEARGWQVPANGWTLATVPHFADVAAACAAGVDAEIANAALYDDLMLAALPGDVQMVFANNRAASLDNHLPAFERCGGGW